MCVSPSLSHQRAGQQLPTLLALLGCLDQSPQMHVTTATGFVRFLPLLQRKTPGQGSPETPGSGPSPFLSLPSEYNLSISLCPHNGALIRSLAPDCRIHAPHLCQKLFKAAAGGIRDQNCDYHWGGVAPMGWGNILGCKELHIFM